MTVVDNVEHRAGPDNTYAQQKQLIAETEKRRETTRKLVDYQEDCNTWNNCHHQQTKTTGIMIKFKAITTKRKATIFM